MGCQPCDGLQGVFLFLISFRRIRFIFLLLSQPSDFHLLLRRIKSTNYIPFVSRIIDHSYHPCESDKCQFDRLRTTSHKRGYSQISTRPSTMVLWGFRWTRLFLNPYRDDDFEHISVRPLYQLPEPSNFQ